MIRRYHATEHATSSSAHNAAGVLASLAVARGWLVVLACALVLAGQTFVAWR